MQFFPNIINHFSVLSGKMLKISLLKLQFHHKKRFYTSQKTDNGASLMMTELLSKKSIKCGLSLYKRIKYWRHKQVMFYILAETGSFL